MCNSSFFLDNLHKVKVYFVLSDNVNHFEEKSFSEESSSLALLDSRILDESSSKLEEDSKIIGN